MLSAEENAPNLTESTEISPSSKSPERETHQTEEVCELVKSSGVRGEIAVRDFSHYNIYRDIACTVSGHSIQQMTV